MKMNQQNLPSEANRIIQEYGGAMTIPSEEDKLKARLKAEIEAHAATIQREAKLSLRLAELEKQEPIYQIRFASSDWVDVTKVEYERINYAKGRTLYTRPVPAVPEGWLRAIDEALVVAHLGVANNSDTYEEARKNLHQLICFEIGVATDPAVNGGWRLVPVEPTPRMRTESRESYCNDGDEMNIYDAMLQAAPKQGDTR